MRVPRLPALRTVAPAAIAAGLVALAMQGGGYALGVRNPVGIAVWWAVALAVAAGLWPLRRIPRAALVAAALLGAWALLSGVSALWADSAEGAFAELGRITLYAGLFLAVVCATRPGDGARWADGLAFGTAAVGLVALSSRLLPGLGADSSASEFFPGGFTFLAYPLEYWNALAFVIALGMPLLLRAATAGRTALTRAVAVGVMPALICALYLTSSRGGILVAAVVIAAFALLSGRMARVALAAAVGLAGGVDGIAVLSARSVLVDGPFDSPALAAQGRTAALLIGLLCLLAGGAWTALSRLDVRIPRPSRAVKRVAIGAAVALLVAGVVAADPLQRFESFSEPPLNRVEAAADESTYTGTVGHLTGDTGNGRWQFWTAAVDEFTDRPLLGHGAGSYESWWAQHGTISYFTRQAHSLYLETLGELGLAGILLVLGLLAVVALAAAKRLRGSSGDERVTRAALAAAGLGFAIAAGIDWMWEMTAVGAVGVVLFALLTGPATNDAGEDDPSAGPRRARARSAIAAAGAAAVAVLALPWLADREVRDSRIQALAGNAPAALDAARAAQRLTPWATSPRMQRALVLEGAGDLRAARRTIADAIARDASDWRLWLVAARIERSQGHPVAAAAALRRAKALNPRSPIFVQDGAS